MNGEGFVLLMVIVLGVGFLTRFFKTKNLNEAVSVCFTAFILEIIILFLIVGVVVVFDNFDKLPNIDPKIFSVINWIIAAGVGFFVAIFKKPSFKY